MCATWWREWTGRCRYGGAYRDEVLRSLITLKALTFASTGADGPIRQWARFIFFNAIGGIVNFTVYVLVAIKLREAYDWTSQIAAVLPYLGVACGSVSGLAFNFLTSKFFVFR